MDAILYFEKKRGLQTWNIVSIRQEGYLLVRVEMDAGKAGWFGRALPESPRPFEEPVSGGWLKKRRERRTAQEKYRARLQAYELFWRELEAENRRLAEEIEELLRRAGVTGRVSCVYGRGLGFLTGGEAMAGRRVFPGEEAIAAGTAFPGGDAMAREKAHTGGNAMTERRAYAEERAAAEENGPMREASLIEEVWNRYIDWPLFRDYTDLRWTRLLLAEACESEFILLGFAECIPAVLEYCARGMRELRWYLAEQDHVAAEEIAEDFYLEYGLAASIRILSGRHPFRKPELAARRPVCVLDFTEESKICPGELAPGSLWMDFLSIEEKEERIRRFSPEVRYLSLKRRWRTLKPKTCRPPIPPRLAAMGERPGYLSEFSV
ncbi:MAG: pre-mRNA-splicing factor SPF27 family protein [Roseburia sp.]|nr:pre-mRNA-splicing factor SPF27 family protein [Roseburia sp.]MCM1098263.1 pre-mRNA-splicing factor SPF27 family protein [Ruminococcus flavefaciens]